MGEAADAGEPAPPDWKQLALIFAARTTLNTAHRIVYPFLPALARGLGISLAAASGLVTVRFFAGLAAPLLGPWIDRRPRRQTMELALALLVLAGILLAGGSMAPAAGGSMAPAAGGSMAPAAGGSMAPAAGDGGLATPTLDTTSYAIVAGAFALFGLSKVLYDPAVHAYVGDTVPYQQRGRIIGMIELSWSSAWLLGVPVAGFLIDRHGWRAPWFLLVVLGLLALGLTRAGLPLVRPGRTGAAGRQRARTLLRRWHGLLRQRQVVALLATSLLLMMAMELPFIVYGAWLERAFGLGLSTLGLASVVVGLAEAAAELGTTLLTDRVGKRRSVLAGLVGLTSSLLVLPLLAGQGLAGALTGVVLVVLSFEFAIVSLLPLATELAPGARGSLLSLNIATFSLGRILGATAGGWLWQWAGAGIVTNTLTGAACALLAALVVRTSVVEP